MNDKTENWILGDAQVNPFTDRAHIFPGNAQCSGQELIVSTCAIIVLCYFVQRRQSNVITKGQTAAASALIGSLN